MSEFDAATYKEAVSMYPDSEWAAQLGEECDELARAASKYRRATDPDSIFTPVTKEEAFDKILEELSDVLTCVRNLGIDLSPNSAHVVRMAEIQKMKELRFMLQHNTHRHERFKYRHHIAHLMDQI